MTQDLPKPMDITEISLQELSNCIDEVKTLAQQAAANVDDPDTQKRYMESLVKLRLLSWRAQKGANEVRERSNTAKLEADSSFLDVQNVRYQHKHLRKEIDRANQYSLRHDLDLVPLDEFLKDNPEFAGENVDEHDLYIGRLKDEERRRIELFMQKQKLQTTRNVLANELKRLQDDLQNDKELEAQVTKLQSAVSGAELYFSKH